jgi:hypothetical protein
LAITEALYHGEVEKFKPIRQHETAGAQGNISPLTWAETGATLKEKEFYPS